MPISGYELSHISVRKLSPNKLSKINEGKISPVIWSDEIRRSGINNKNWGIYEEIQISFPLIVGIGERNFPPTLVLSPNPSPSKVLCV